MTSIKCLAIPTFWQFKSMDLGMLFFKITFFVFKGFRGHKVIMEFIELVHCSTNGSRPNYNNDATKKYDERERGSDQGYTMV